MEKAEWAKLYVLFRQLSGAHKREILQKAEALAVAESRETPESRNGGHLKNARRHKVSDPAVNEGE
jgi:hypothetical protein